MINQLLQIAILLNLAGAVLADEPQPTRRNVQAILRELKVIDNIVFKQVGDVRLELMLFLPLEKKYDKAPLVVYIHGGGWGGGDRTKVYNRDIIEVVQELNRNGIACASIEYRLADGGNAMVNDSIADCKDAVRFLAINADKYNFDADRFGTFGSSAGGHLTLMTALADDASFDCDPTLKSASYKIRCVAAFYPLVSFTDSELLRGSNFERPQRFLTILGGLPDDKPELAKKLSPIEWLCGDSPAIFLAHGDNDTVLSHRNSVAMQQAAIAKGVTVDCVISKGAGHGFRGNAIDPSVAEISQRAAEFFIRHVTREVDFVGDVQPIFREHCESCHGATNQKSEYRLDVREWAIRGGDFGEPAIVPGNSAESPLVHYVAGLDEATRMPPAKSDQDRLTVEQISVLRAWIDQGAVWPDSASAKLVDKRDWWSLKPMTRPVVPIPTGGNGDNEENERGRVGKKMVVNPIDAFIGAKLVEQGLIPSPQADRRTLIRRLYFDLLGLPPRPEAIDKFLNDSDPMAWERFVDRVLESPRYGERWARHWLDIVHYGETHGYDKDRPRNNAWPYRDYVIRSLNEDKPYARFVQEQIAGDVLFPGTRDGIEALGFIAAGPWDLISHAEVPESKLDGKIARHIDRDDMVQNTMLTFNSMTIGCAQCHDHKFDAISQEDYYCLQAVFAAIDRTDVSYFADDEIEKRSSSLTQAKSKATEAIAEIENPLKKQAGEALQMLNQRIADAPKSGNSNAEYGYHSSISKEQAVTKWVQVDLGKSVRIDRVDLLPCFDDFNKIGAGFGFPIRFKIEACDDPEFASGVAMFWFRHHETFMADFTNPGLRPFSTKAGMGEIQGRYVRVTATKLAPRKEDFIFAIAELQVFDEAGTNLAIGCPVTALDSVEAAPRWRTTNLTDGIAPESSSPDDRRELIAQRDALILSFADDTTRKTLAELRREVRQADIALKELPEPNVVYAGAVHTGNGNFRGTGREGGKPREIHILNRGDVKDPRDEVGPGALSAVECLLSRFELPTNHTEGQRRAALALWLTNPEQPLTWRSIVNRVWQFHFGRGLVDTPNDFGRNGALPSHPELLDWLACEFRDGGGSLKNLHKQIVTSKTYRQSSSVGSEGSKEHSTTSFPSHSSVPASEAVDSDNLFLSRMNRRKLDAESLRDSVLFISGKLDLKMGGPSYQDFVLKFPEHSPHYEYELHDPDDPVTHRRSIYRFIVRSQLEPFMTALDCADPSMQVDKRNESMSPIQALALLNNGLMVTMSKHFAEKLDARGGDMERKVELAFLEALGRSPAPVELSSFTEYSQQFGLANMCRVIFNLNEFAFVD